MSDEGAAETVGAVRPDPDAARKPEFVIVDHELSPSQIRNLERANGAEVLDRTGVIVEIFHRHANTREARLQVEMARLKYVAPRMRESSAGGGRQQGPGAGESTLDLDRRKIRDRISELKDQLEAVQRDGDQRRSARRDQLRVALVGCPRGLGKGITTSSYQLSDKLAVIQNEVVKPYCVTQINPAWGLGREFDLLMATGDKNTSRHIYLKDQLFSGIISEDSDYLSIPKHNDYAVFINIERNLGFIGRDDERDVWIEGSADNGTLQGRDFNFDTETVFALTTLACVFHRIYGYKSCGMVFVDSPKSAALRAAERLTAPSRTTQAIEYFAKYGAYCTAQTLRSRARPRGQSLT